MSEIDYFLKFASLAAAKADAVMVAQATNLDDQGIRQFLADKVISGLQCWRASQDVAGTDIDGNPIVTHTFLTGYFVSIHLPVVIPALLNHAAVQIVLDRDLARTRTAGMVLKSTVSGAILQDLRFSPVVHGADYPFGGLG